MEENKITWSNKVTLVARPNLPPQNKVTAADMNQVKTGLNATIDELILVEGRVTTTEGDITTLQTDLTTAEGNITTLQTDLTTAEGAISTLGTNKEDTANKATDFTVVNDVKFPTTQAVDTKIDEEIDLQIPVANTNQIVNNAGVADIVSIYDVNTVSNITFQKSAIYGTEELPTYYALTASLTGARHNNNVLMIHSSLLIPTLLTATKPSSPLAPYADQAVMLAGQAGQVSGQHYYYTGSTSAWLWNGVSGGVIGNYTEVPEIAGWEEWGTKPEWLNITGSYLVGADNINYLDFTYSRITGEVELVVTSKAGGNLDPLRVTKLHTIIDIDYTGDPLDTVTATSLDNETIYGVELEPAIINPSFASFVDLGGGQSAMSMGTATGSLARVEAEIGDYLSQLWDGEEICIIKSFSMTPSGAFTARQMFSNQDSATFTGLLFELNATTTIRFQIGNNASFQGANSSAFTAVLEDGSRYLFIGTFKRVGGTSTMRFYRYSPDNLIPFEFINEVTTANVRDIRSKTTLMFNRINSGSTQDPTTDDRLIVLTKIPTDLELQAIAESIIAP